MSPSITRTAGKPDSQRLWEKPNRCKNERLILVRFRRECARYLPASYRYTVGRTGIQIGVLPGLQR